MKRETAKRLHDARTACLEIDEFTAGRSIESVWTDRALQLSLQKLLEIIGEALNRAYESEPETVSVIPNLRLIVDMRNRLTHGYDSVDYAVVWRVSTEEIPSLTSVL